jgi:hypothetical protein
MILQSAFRLLILSAILSAISGCAEHTKIVKLYEDKSIRDTPYDTVLVVGITPDVNERRKLEDLLSQELRVAGSNAVPTYSLAGLTQSVLQDDIDTAAIKANAGAILITHIVSVDKDFEFQKGRTEVLFECRGGDPADYFLYDQKVLKLPDSVLIAHTVVAVTSLYDTASNARVWTIQSTCFRKESMDEVLQEESSAIVRQLRFDRLIK